VSILGFNIAAAGPFGALVGMMITVVAAAAQLACLGLVLVMGTVLSAMDGASGDGIDDVERARYNALKAIWADGGLRGILSPDIVGLFRWDGWTGTLFAFGLIGVLASNVFAWQGEGSGVTGFGLVTSFPISGLLVAMVPMAVVMGLNRLFTSTPVTSDEHKFFLAVTIALLFTLSCLAAARAAYYGASVWLLRLSRRQISYAR
jgi:hypothetical protein